MLSRVLALLDGSPTMAEIIPMLRQMWGGTGAVVHLLLVRPPIQGPLRLDDRLLYLDELLQTEQATWRDYLMRQGSQLAYDGIVVRRTVRLGDFLMEVLAAAECQPVQLIALVAQQEGWPKRLVRPSLAQQLLAQSPVPVLVVPPASHPEARLIPRYSSSPV